MEKEILELVGKLRGIKNVLAIYLFGSYANGKIHANSDIDICVIGHLGHHEQDKVKEIFGCDVYDLSFFNELPIWIRFRVLRDGKMLFARDMERLERICFGTIKEYLSFQPVLNKLIEMRFGKCMTCRE